MTPRTRMPASVLAVALCAAVLAAGCGDGRGGDHAGASSTTTTSTTATSTTASAVPSTTARALPAPTADIMATAAHQLVTVDHTFGAGTRPFRIFFVQDHTDPSAGVTVKQDHTAPSAGSPDVEQSSRPLTDAERTEIERRIGSLGEVVWIDDPADYWGETGPMEVGGAIVGLGEPTIDGTRALAPVSLECGNACGTWFTYSLATDATGRWAITGIDGSIAVS